MVSGRTGLGNQLSGNTSFDEIERACHFGFRVARIAENRMAAAQAMD